MNADDPIQVDLLQRARETQALLTGPFSHLGSVDTLTILGKRQRTPISVPTKDGAYVQEYKNQKGDSLVPEKITMRLIGDPVHDRRKVFTGKVNAHSMLCVDPDVQSLIDTFFKEDLLPLPTT